MSSRKTLTKKSKAEPSKQREASIEVKDAGKPRLQTDASGRIVEYSTPEDICPICKSDRYLSPNLRLLVSQCYHKLCESCIDRIFTLGPEPCPTCGQILRKSSFNPQTFENLGVEKEVVIRKRIARCFNKRQEDFLTLRDYNNYLEEVEGIIFNLVNGVEIAETEAKIRRYEAENRDNIATNSARSAKEVELQKRVDDAQQRDRQARRSQIMQMDQELVNEDERLRKEAINDLERSDVSARTVISRQRALALKSRSAGLAEVGIEARSDSDPLVPSYAGLVDHHLDSADAFDPLAELYDIDDGGYLCDDADFRATKIGPVFPYAATEDELSLIGGFHQYLVVARDVQSAVSQLFVPPA